METRNEPSTYLVREFDVERDYALLCAWWDVHRAKGPVPPVAMLPRVGLVALRAADGQPEACAFLFLLANASLCIIEYPATRPGIGLGAARAAFDAIVTVLKKTAADLGYAVILAYTLPAIARELRRHRFQEIRSGLVMTAARTA